MKKHRTIGETKKTPTLQSGKKWNKEANKMKWITAEKKPEENAESNDSEILINQSIPISKYLVHKNNSF